MVELLDSSRYTYRRTLRSSSVFEWFYSLRPPGIRLVGLLKAIRVSRVLTLKGYPVFEYLAS